MSLFRPTTERTDDQVEEEPNPHLPAGYDDPDGDVFVHPDLRPHWGLDQDEEHSHLADQRAFSAWAADRAYALEYQRRVAEEGWPADWPARTHQTNLARAGWAPPLPSREDRAAYAHAVRTMFAAQRLHLADRAADVQRRHVEAMTCATGHTDTTTRRRTLHGVDAQLCDRCALVAEARLVARLAELDLDGTSYGDRVDAWIDQTRGLTIHTVPAVTDWERMKQRIAADNAYLAAEAAGGLGGRFTP